MVKIGDFGTSKVLSGTMAKARTQIGTPYYLSPEIIQERPYSFSTDVWSMGILLAELCLKKPPFDATSIMALGKKICSGVYTPIPSHYSQNMKNLVKSCLQVQVAKRPTVNQILNMPFVKDRIIKFLDEMQISNEFSHTVLHGQNLFKQPKPSVNDNSDIPMMIKPGQKMETVLSNEEKKQQV